MQSLNIIITERIIKQVEETMWNTSRHKKDITICCGMCRICVQIVL
jgi:hypothetical protein